MLTKNPASSDNALISYSPFDVPGSHALALKCKDDMFIANTEAQNIMFM